VHGLAFLEFVFSNHRQIILGVTSGRAGIASNAQIQINRHAPTMFIMMKTAFFMAFSVLRPIA